MPWSEEVKAWPKSEQRLLARYVILQEWVKLEGNKLDLQAQKRWPELAGCVYDTLKKQAICYDLEPFLFDNLSNQIIRSPDDILSLKKGTCLDLALLYVGACLANDLIACVVVLQGHALALVASKYDQRTPELEQNKRMAFDNGLITDRDQIEKLLEAGYVPVECTGFAQSDVFLPETRVNGVMTFENATKAGFSALESEQQPFVFALDAAFLHLNGFPAWGVKSAENKGSDPPSDKPINPIDLQPVSPSPDWIGPDREQTLEGYLTDLERKRFTAIKGLPGMGKSSFAAELARRCTGKDDTRIFWFTFINPDWVSMCRHLAVFLDIRNGNTTLEQMVLSDPKPNLSDLLTSLVAQTQANEVLCLDDLKDVEDAQLKTLLHIIATGVPEGTPPTAKFILIGQDFPTEIENKMDPSRLELSGYTPQDTTLWLEHKGLQFTPSECTEIWKASQGCPELLEMAVQAFKDTGRTVIQVLQDQPASVIAQIYQTLSTPERKVLDAMVTFERPADEFLLREIAKGENAPAPDKLIEDLVDALLLSRLNRNVNHHTPTILRCSGLIRLHRQNAISEIERVEYHEIAALYYQSKAAQIQNTLSISLLRSAHHTIAAGRAKDAVDLLEPKAAQIIDAGEVWALERLLNEIKPETIPSSCAARVKIMQADVKDHLGHFDEACTLYTAAAQTVDGNWALLARILEGLGNAYNRSGQPNSADLALTQLQKCRDLRVLLNDRAQIAEAYRLIGMVHYRKQAFQDANEQLGHALEIAIQLREDPNSAMSLLETKIQFGLGIVMMNNPTDGEGAVLEKARDLFEKCRHAFHDQGNRRREAQVIGNLILLNERLGNAPEQLQAYKDVLALQIEISDFAEQRTTYNNFGFWCMTQQKFNEALEAYQKLFDLSNRTGHLKFESFALAGMADARRALGQLPESLQDAQSALKCATRISPTSPEYGVSLRALGETQLVSGQISEARTSLEGAVKLLTDSGKDFEPDFMQAKMVLEKLNIHPDTASNPAIGVAQ